MAILNQAIVLLCVGTLFQSTLALQKSSIVVTGNPHISSLGKKQQFQEETKCDPSQSSCGPSNTAISPHEIITTAMVTQADTLQRIVTVKYMGVPVPIHLFKQPSRLSHAELPFKLALVRGSTPQSRGMVELAVPVHQSMDSWFPGYRWSVLVCQRCDDVVHMGWQFTSETDSFTALIVDFVLDEDEKVAAPSLLDGFKVGTSAPAWIVSLLALSASTNMKQI